MPETKPTITTSKSPDYRSITVTGVYGGSRTGYIEAAIYTDLITSVSLDEKPDQSPPPTINREVQCTLIIPIPVAKQIVTWLHDHIGNYEKAFGAVKTQAQAPTNSEDTQDILKIILQFNKKLDDINARLSKIEERR